MADDDDVTRAKPRGPWPWIWLSLLAFFGIAEGIALFNDKGGDTLTEQVQYVGGFQPWLLVIACVAFAAWLIDHFVGRDSRIWKWREWRNRG